MKKTISTILAAGADDPPGPLTFSFISYTNFSIRLYFHRRT